MMWGRGVYDGYGAAEWLLLGTMLFFALLVLVGLVLIVWWLVRLATHNDEGWGYEGGDGMRQVGAGGPPHVTMGERPGGGGGSRRDPAAAAARERYARGEITEDQLAEIMHNLGYPMSPRGEQRR